MELSSQIISWFNQLKGKTVFYEKGLFKFKSDITTPERTIKSISSYHFFQTNKKKGFLTSKNPIQNTALYYYELEEGIWIMATDIQVKHSFIFENDIHKDPSEHYYFVNFHISDSSNASNKFLFNGMSSSENELSIAKPFSNKILCHLKNSDLKNLTLYFREDKLNSNSKYLEFTRHSIFKGFKGSDNQRFSLEMTENQKFLFQEFVEVFNLANYKEKREKIIVIALKFNETVLENFNLHQLGSKYFDLKDADQNRIIKVEEVLKESIFQSFIGIDHLANIVGISSSKLKVDFKKVHEKSIFNYFRELQMNHAKSILESKSMKIKNIASLLGYENASKFSIAFKNQFGLSPSDIGMD